MANILYIASFLQLSNFQQQQQTTTTKPPILFTFALSGATLAASNRRRDKSRSVSEASPSSSGTRRPSAEVRADLWRICRVFSPLHFIRIPPELLYCIPSKRQTSPLPQRYNNSRWRRRGEARQGKPRV